MALLARITDFTPSTPILSGEVDAEFNQLVNILSGTSTNKNAVIRYSNASDPPLKLDQLGLGAIQQWSQTGLVKASVTNDGSFSTSRQFISTLATGTKPIDVTSTTLCVNLNADQVDGLDAASFARVDNSSNQVFIGNILISNNAPQITFADGDNSKQTRIALNNTTWFFINDTLGTTPLSIGMADNVATFLAIPVGPASDPTTSNQLTRKAYVDSLALNAVQNNVSGEFVTDDFKISGSAPVLTFEDTTGGAADWTWGLNGDALTGKFVGDADFITFNRGTSVATLAAGLAVNNDLDVNGTAFGVLQGVVADTTSNANSGTGETDLTSYTIPANSLRNAGDYIRFNLRGSKSGAAAPTLRAYIAGTQIFSLVTNASATAWSLDVIITRLTNTTVRTFATYHGTHINYNDGGAAETDIQRTTGTTVASLSGSTNIFKATGQGSASSQITQELLIGERMIF
jgi:hypothetical protein